MVSRHTLTATTSPGAIEAARRAARSVQPKSPSAAQQDPSQDSCHLPAPASTRRNPTPQRSRDHAADSRDKSDGDSGADPDDDNERRPPDSLRLLSKKQVADLLAVNPFTIDRWRRTDATFPEPLWVTPTTCRWRRTDIQAWLNARPAGGRSPAWDKGLRGKPLPRPRPTTPERSGGGDD
jgi:predicted DNA-binding transcriptional regulator AlpA